jgi:hypothetical protein
MEIVSGFAPPRRRWAWKLLRLSLSLSLVCFPPAGNKSSHILSLISAEVFGGEFRFAEEHQGFERAELGSVLCLRICRERARERRKWREGESMGMDMALLWSLLGFFSLVRGFLPQELTEMLEKWWNALLRPANYSYFHIPDDGISGVTNDLYRVVQLYLIAANLCSAADELVLSRDENEEGITYNLAGRRNTSLFSSNSSRSFSEQIRSLLL